MRSLAFVAFVMSALPIDAQAPGTPPHVTSRAYNVALGVECDHCHNANDYRDRTEPAFDFAVRMEAMVRGINDGPLRNRVGVTCWSCHRGHAIPARLPRDAWESIQSAHAADFVSAPSRSLAMSVYAASLGVDCGHCHVAGDWKSERKPAHQTVAQMDEIFSVIPTFFQGSARQPRTQCFMCHQGRTTPERAAPERQR